MNLLTAEQQSRFEAFRRSSLNKRNMKRVRAMALTCWDICSALFVYNLRVLFAVSCCRFELSTNAVRKVRLQQAAHNGCLTRLCSSRLQHT